MKLRLGYLLLSVITCTVGMLQYNVMLWLIFAGSVCHPSFDCGNILQCPSGRAAGRWTLS